MQDSQPIEDDLDRAAVEHRELASKIRAGRRRSAWTTVRDQKRAQARSRGGRLAKVNASRQQAYAERQRAVANLAAVIRAMNSPTATDALRKNATKTFESNVDRVMEEAGIDRDAAISRVYAIAAGKES